MNDAGVNPENDINDVIKILNDYIEQKQPEIIQENLLAAHTAKYEIVEHAQKSINAITDNTLQLLSAVKKEESELKKLQKNLDRCNSILLLALESTKQGPEEMFITSNTIKPNLLAVLSSNDTVQLGKITFEPNNPQYVGTVKITGQSNHANKFNIKAQQWNNHLENDTESLTEKNDKIQQNDRSLSRQLLWAILIFPLVLAITGLKLVRTSLVVLMKFLLWYLVGSMTVFVLYQMALWALPYASQCYNHPLMFNYMNYWMK